MINRAAVLLRYREPAVQWINDADPYSDDPGISQDDVNRERTVYLISDEDAETDEAVEAWVELNYRVLFEEELQGWYSDPELWPRDLSFELFQAWFDVEWHTVILDTVGGEIYDDEPPESD